MKLYYKFENNMTKDEGTTIHSSLEELATQLSGEFIVQVLTDGKHQINIETTDTSFKISCDKQYAMCQIID